MCQMNIKTRFAPSPTGNLHLGHAYAALFAEANGNQFVLRIENIDFRRCKPEFEKSIIDDLKWLGLRWQTPIRRQSDQMHKYSAALERLHKMELLYPCFCTRSDIQREIKNAGNAPHYKETGGHYPIYPQTCKRLNLVEKKKYLDSNVPFALRMDMNAAIQIAGKITWNDLNKGEQEAKPESFGDIVIARKDIPTSYHLSVVVDDNDQNINLVTRAHDLFSSSHVHRLLQALLGYDLPNYLHHSIIKDDQGNQLSKRDKPVSLQDLKNNGASPTQIRRRLGFE